MKKYHICHMVFMLLALLLGCVSCSDSNMGESYDVPGNNGGNVVSADEVCINWNVDQNYVQEHTKNSTIESQDASYLGYSNTSGVKMAYSFKDDKLIASAVMMSVNAVKGSEITKLLSNYNYVGDINLSKVYTGADNNTMATWSTKNVGEEKFYIVGFAPIESALYDKIPIPQVTTVSAANIDAHGAKLEGQLENVSVDCRVGFQYSDNKNMVDCKTVLSSGNSGDFSKTISGLSMGTTYYYRACAVVDGIYYFGETLSFETETLPTYQVGDFYPNSANPEGVVFYTSSDGTTGKIVSLDQGYGEWDTQGFFSKRCYCTSTTNGAINKIPTNKPFGEWVKNHGNEWYGPAREELKTLSRVISTVNKTLSQNGYTNIGNIYWSSTEDSQYYSSQAYVVCVAEKGFITTTNGTVYSHTKDEHHGFIAVKTF